MYREQYLPEILIVKDVKLKRLLHDPLGQARLETREICLCLFIHQHVEKESNIFAFQKLKMAQSVEILAQEQEDSRLRGLGFEPGSCQGIFDSG